MESKQRAETDAPSSNEDAGKAVWSSAINSIYPWNKSKEVTASDGVGAQKPEPKMLNAADDHLTTPLYGRSLRAYPKGCPALRVQWFHAIDVPKRNTQHMLGGKAPAGDKDKPPTKPKKFTQFSASDSVRIEEQYQALLEAEEDERASNENSAELSTQRSRPTTWSDGLLSASKSTPVPVNEDFLFDVFVPKRELYPVYWAGPVYEVRRGTWFFQDGSNLRPCEENLAAQIEEGYLKMKPWTEPEGNETFSENEQPNEKLGPDKSSTSNKKRKAQEEGKTVVESAPKPRKVRSHRLFGAYMASTVTYEDQNTAWLTSDGMLSWVTNSVYERFAGGGYMSGVKLVRGYSELAKGRNKDSGARSKTPTPDAEHQRKETGAEQAEEPNTNNAPGQGFLKRKLSNIINDEDRRAPKTEEEVRKLNEQEMRHDYLTQSGESQSREIQHLVLVTHGIGQRLSLRMQGVNFIHDVNVLRKTLKAVYSNSADLRSLNHDEGDGPGNCRVQVLPVCWRHKLDFPKQRRKNPEADLADLASEDLYPSLEDITVDGVAFARSLISDLALDVLLYQSSYRDEIAKTVTDESNRIVSLFQKRNPEFRGKIHVVGHSLGSAILFDILCQQHSSRKQGEDRMRGLRFWPSASQSEEPKQHQSEAAFNFEVEDLYCLGSPTGLFQMLNGRSIAARPHRRYKSQPGPKSIQHEDLPPDVASPDISQLFNIFYPSDPISYRLEPLIASSMAKLKPHQMPYTKKGLFGAVRPQGLTDIGSKVGQSFSGLWSSLSTGLSSNFVPPSLKLTGEEIQQVGEAHDATRGERTQKADVEGGHPALTEQGGNVASHEQETAPAQAATSVTDAELDTLYSNFYLYGQPHADDTEQEDINGEDDETRKIRMAKKKVWDLNRNGRVDFSIQEGALDFNPISTIASHIGYWADEDVNHFVLTQLLVATPDVPAVDNLRRLSTART